MESRPQHASAPHPAAEGEDAVRAFMEGAAPAVVEGDDVARAFVEGEAPPEPVAPASAVPDSPAEERGGGPAGPGATFEEKINALPDLHASPWRRALRRIAARLRAARER